MTRESNVLIVGSGVAGLTTALNLSRFARVTVITKKDADDTSTSQAQGGIATVLDAADRFEYHIRDTHVAGAGLCRSEAVESIIREGPQAIRELMNFGARFNVSAGGELDLGREGGHSHRRIVHAEDMTGREIERALLQAVRASDRIRLLENYSALNLVTATDSGSVNAKDIPGNRCIGCYVHNEKTDEIIPWSAHAVVLATGGAGKVYLYTSNPDVATGAGVVLAMAPLAFLGAFGIWALLVFVTGYVSLGSVVAAASLPLLTMWLYPGRPAVLWITAALGALVVWMHRGNIGRLLKGTESRFGRNAKEAGS